MSNLITADQAAALNAAAVAQSAISELLRRGVLPQPVVLAAGPTIVAAGRINSDGSVAQATDTVAGCVQNATGDYTITLVGTYSPNDGKYGFQANATFIAHEGVTHDGPYDSGSGIYVIDVFIRGAADAATNAYFDFVLVKV